MASAACTGPLNASAGGGATGGGANATRPPFSRGAAGVQCPIATCSGGQLGSTGCGRGAGVQCPMAACSTGQFGSCTSASCGAAGEGVQCPMAACSAGQFGSCTSATCEAAGEGVQCPMAACSGEQLGSTACVGGADVQWPMAACSGAQAASAAASCDAGVACPACWAAAGVAVRMKKASMMRTVRLPRHQAAAPSRRSSCRRACGRADGSERPNLPARQP